MGMGQGSCGWGKVCRNGARCVGMGQGAWEWGKVRGNGARYVGMGQGVLQNWTKIYRFPELD